MVDIQTIGVLVTAASVSVAAIYYMFTLRINQKNLQTNIETRQIQLLMDLSQMITSQEGMKRWAEWLSMEWTDYEDFEKKYSSDINPDSFALRFSLSWWLEKMGFLVKHGMIKPELIWEFWPTAVLQSWSKFKEINLKQRVVYGQPLMWNNWEYLYNEIARIAKENKYGTDYSQLPFRSVDRFKES